MALPVSQSRSFNGRLRKLSAGTKASLQTHYMRLVLVIGTMLLYNNYRVTKTGELKATLRLEKLHDEPYPVDTNWHHELESNATEGPPVTFDRCVNKNHIALTFDDGPSALTLALLDVFDKYNVKATFFF
ncbi:hypothetical protein Gpo141_00013634, partial [Globisporangium polare]